MTIEDAKIAMKEGKKVTHKRLGYKTWVTINKYDKIVFDNGETLSQHVFWFSRMDDVFNDGWSVVNLTND
jgi:ASC-1-like (ASCH) protein